MMEIELWDSAGNKLAAPTDIYMTSTHSHSFRVGLCYDGNKGTMCHSGGGAAWMRAKYKGLPSRILVTNRRGCCNSRTNGATVSISTSSDNSNALWSGTAGSGWESNFVLPAISFPDTSTPDTPSPTPYVCPRSSEDYVIEISATADGGKYFGFSRTKLGMAADQAFSGSVFIFEKVGTDSTGSVVILGEACSGDTSAGGVCGRWYDDAAAGDWEVGDKARTCKPRKAASAYSSGHWSVLGGPATPDAADSGPTTASATSASSARAASPAGAPGGANKVNGAFNLAVAGSASEFVKSPAVKTAIKNSLAEALNIDPIYITVIVEVDGQRMLYAARSGSVKVSYVIEFPSGTTRSNGGAEITATRIKDDVQVLSSDVAAVTEQVMKHIDEEVGAGVFVVTVTSVTAEVPPLELSAEDQAARNKDSEGSLEPSAVGDPHVTNVDGQRFDIMRTGVHSLIEIPRGKGSELIVKGRIERVPSACKVMYIRQVSVSGSLLKADYEFSVNPSYDEQDTTSPRFFYRSGNYTTSNPHEFEKVVDSSEVQMRMRPKSPWYPIKTNVKIALLVGPAAVFVDFNMNAGVHSDHFDLDASKLGLIAERNNIGGLMGIDDHSFEITEEACDDAASDELSSMRQLKEMTLDNVGSVMGASM